MTQKTNSPERKIGDTIHTLVGDRIIEAYAYADVLGMPPTGTLVGYYTDFAQPFDPGTMLSDGYFTLAEVAALN